MISRLTPAVVATVLCCGISSADAGQLHIEWFGLDRVAQDAGYAIRATVSKVDTPKGWIEVVVQRTWTQATNTRPPTGTFSVRLYKGIEWTDPHESPTDERFVGSICITRLKPGQEILLVPLNSSPPAEASFEARPWTARSAVHLDAHFTAGGAKKYQERSSTADLRRDLADWDLFHLAYAALTHRKAHSAKALLTAGTSRLPVPPISHHLKKLDPKGVRRFLTEAAAVVAGDAKAQERLFPRVAAHLTPETAAAFGALYAGAEPDTEAARAAAWTLSHWARTHQRPSDLAPFSRFVARYAAQRPDGKKPRELARLLCNKLQGKALEQLGVALLVAAPGTQKDGTIQTDPFLFRTAARCAVRGPGRSYVRHLARVTPETVQNSREAVFASLLDMATVIGGRHRQSLAALDKIVAPWLAVARNVDAERLQKWQALPRR